MAGSIDLGEVKLDTRKAQKSAEDLDSSFESIKKALKDISGEGVKTAFGEVFRQIATGAVAAERSSVALRGLGTAYQQVQAATRGAVTAQAAFDAQNAITQSGLRVSGEQLAVVARAAREFALRTGTDSAQAMQQLTQALVAGDAQAMRPFGISVQVGTLRTQAFRQALGQLATQQRTTAASAETLEESTNRLGHAWDAFKNDVSAAAAETLQLKSAFSELADALESLVDGGPLVHNFFSGILQDITGIQQARTGTAEDRTRNSTQLSRERLIGQIAQYRNVPGLDFSALHINQLSGPAAERLQRALTTRGTSVAAIQAEINRAAGVSSVEQAQRASAVAAAGRPNTAQNARDDQNERTRNMSAVDWFQLREDQRQARLSVDAKIRELQAQGIRTSPAMRSRLYSLINGFLVPMNRLAFQREMSLLEGQAGGLSGGGFSGLGGVQSRYGSGLTNQQYTDLIAADRDKASAAAEMGVTVGAITRAGRRYAGDSVLLGGSSTDSLFSRYGTGLSAETYGQLAEAEQGKASARAEMGATVAGLDRRGQLGGQLESFFSDTQTLAEKGSKGFTDAFQTMSGAVSGFIDTLIEGQVPAGEAAVGLAKAALKGLAMQAVPEALFETAKGFAALATANPMAAVHFKAAGIYTAVAVGAGAAAAGISAAQHGAQGSSPSALPAGTPSLNSGGSRDGGGGGTVIFNINSTVFDPERAEETVARLQRGAQARGL